MIRKVYLAFLLFFISTLGHAQTKSQQWVDSVFQTLTLDQQLGQLFVFPIHGNSDDEHLSTIKHNIDRHSIGGVYIVDGSPLSTITLLNELKSQSTLPLMSMMDVTKGLGTSLSDITPFPNPLSLGSCNDYNQIKNAGKLLGQQLNTLGIDIGLYKGITPQVSSNDFETWGSNPDSISNKISYFIEGMNDEGAFLGPNQFPSIIGRYSKKEIEKLLSPYSAAISSDIKFISLGNQNSSFDQNTPSALSKSVINFIRKDLQFSGLIIAQDLNQTRNYRAGKTEAQSFSMGSELIVTSNISSSIKQIKKLIKKGGLNLSDVQNTIKKVLYYKHAYLHNTNSKSSENLIARLNSPESKKVYNQLLKSSVSAIEGKASIPIKFLADKNVASLNSGNDDLFQSTLDNYISVFHYDIDEPVENLVSYLSLFDHVIINGFNDSKSGKIAQIISALGNEKVIFCGPANANAFKNLPPKTSIITCYDTNKETQSIYPQVIFGGLDTKAKLPIAISNQLQTGDGNKLTNLNRLGFATAEEVGMSAIKLNEIDKVVDEAISEKATPGAQVVVVRKGKVVLQKAYGYYTYDSLIPVNNQSIYDIASITKVAATTQAIMFLYERKMIDLDKKIAVYLPELKGSNKEFMTIRDILTHQAGLWPYLPFWKETLDGETYVSTYYRFSPDDDYNYQISEGLYTSRITKDSVWNWVIKSKLRPKETHKPFDYKYSDMGYYMLQRLTEKMVNQPIEEFLQQNFYDPLGLSTMSYLPLCKFPQNVIAPTENDNYFRYCLVNGMVHDQGAALMGGVAGHAGLFSNALDLAKLMQMNLQNGYYGGIRYFEEGTVPTFTSTQYKSNRRGLGWDKPVVAEWNSPTSTYASPKCFGHTGFTGTAVWVDPEFDLIYVFLSNRIYPDANNTKLIKSNIRTRIQDIIYQSIWEYSATHSDGCK